MFYAIHISPFHDDAVRPFYSGLGNWFGCCGHPYRTRFCQTMLLTNIKVLCLIGSSRISPRRHGLTLSQIGDYTKFPNCRSSQDTGSFNRFASACCLYQGDGTAHNKFHMVSAVFCMLSIYISCVLSIHFITLGKGNWLAATCLLWIISHVRCWVGKIFTRKVTKISVVPDLWTARYSL